MIKELRNFIVENYLFGRDTGFGADESFMEKGIIDSTGVMELVAFVEQTWGVRVEDHELLPENLDSLAKLAAFVERKAGPARPAYGEAVAAPEAALAA